MSVTTCDGWSMIQSVLAVLNALGYLSGIVEDR